METSAIAGAALLMSRAQTQQSVSITIMKQAADQQNQMANLLAQNAVQMRQPINNDFTFSTFA